MPLKKTTIKGPEGETVWSKEVEDIEKDGFPFGFLLMGTFWSAVIALIYIFFGFRVLSFFEDVGNPQLIVIGVIGSMAVLLLLKKLL